MTTVSWRQRLTDNGQATGVCVILLVLVCLGLIRYDNFGSAYNLSSFLNYNAMFVLISLGMCLVIITGGIDLSVGTVAALSSVTAAYASPYGLVPALLAGLATGLAAGLVNAVMITRLHIPPFIATLASLLAAKGAALIISGNQTVPVDWGSGFTRLGMESIGGLLPWSFAITLVVGAGLWWLLEQRPIGRTMLAVGDNEEAAHLMGLPARKAKTLAYLISGGCAGLAGVFLASGFGAGQPLEGLGWELTAIAAVVVGGTLLTGGKGSLVATLIGALMLGLIFNLLNFENGLGTFNLSAYWQMVIRGAFLFVVIAIQVQITRTRNTG
ncbi:ABC transporter permease [Halomonas sp. V046]|uniref:ABC transporter permease n=1 Tax=Halomonas sp. V046 TaxID=3459611 RepID=UPI004043F01E